MRDVPLSLGSGSLILDKVSSSVRPSFGLQGKRLYVLGANESSLAVVDSSSGGSRGAVLVDAPLSGLTGVTSIVAPLGPGGGSMRAAVLARRPASKDVAVALLTYYPGDKAWRLGNVAACDECQDLVASRDGSVLAVFDPGSRTILFLDAQTLANIATLAVPEGYNDGRLVVRPDNDDVYALVEDPMVIDRFFFAQFRAASGSVNLLQSEFPPGQITTDLPRPGTLRFPEQSLGVGYGAGEVCHLDMQFHRHCELTRVTVP